MPAKNQPGEPEERTLDLVRALASSEAKFRGLMEAAPDPYIIYNAEGTIELVNREVERVFGHRRVDLIGANIEVLLPPELRGKAGENPLIVNLGSRIELTCVRADGTPFPAEISISPLTIETGTRVTAVIRDVSARMMIQDALAKALRRTEEAERATQRGSWEWDVTTDRAMWSRGMYKIFGVYPQNFQNSNENFLAMVHPDDRARMGEAMAAALAKPGPFLQEYRFTRADGALRHLRGEGNVVLDADGKARVLYGFVQDVTARREAEEKAREAEIRRAQLELEVSHQEALRLKEVSDLKSAFLDMVAHDLNNVLTPMSINVGLVEDEMHRAGLADSKALARLHRATKRMAFFLADLLDASRLQSGKLALEAKEFDVAATLQECLDSVAAQAAAAGIVLEARLPDALHLRGDARRIEQVVANLLSNALKFTPKGGRVSVELDSDATEARLLVTDTGQGIAAEGLDRLFQPFSRLSSLPQGKHTGTGLGLFVCKGIVEMHGGAISAHSPGLEKGTTFVVALPIKGASSGHASGRGP